MRAVNACSFPIFPHSAQNVCSSHKWEEREGLIHVCQVHLEFLCHSLWRMEVDVTHILQKVKNIISWSATREQPWWLSIAGTVELLQRKAGTPSKHTHDSIENMLQILLPCYSWAEHTNHVPLRSSSHSSSPALFPSALQLLQGAGRAMPGQHRSRAWAPSASPEQMEQCLCSCSELLSGRRTPAHWPGCHKLPGGKKGALLHTAARVCAVLALSAVEQSTGSQQGTPVLPGDRVVLHSSPRAGGCAGNHGQAGRICPDKPHQKEHWAPRKWEGKHQMEGEVYLCIHADAAQRQPACFVVECDRALQMAQRERWQRQSFGGNHREFAKGHGCLLSASSWPHDYGCTDHYWLIKA